MPKVYNRHHGEPPEGSVYVGRGSVYGNPFVIGEHGDRGEVIARFRQYLQERPELLVQVKLELKGKDLVCYCKPAACHGDVLLVTANPEVALGGLFSG